MSILNVEHLSHGFGDRAIFTDVSFRLLKGEHIGLIGANGEGKSTFMNIITGKMMPDEGKVEWSKNVRVGYLDQHTVLEKGMTIRDVLKSAFSFLFEMEEKMNDICAKMGDASEDEMNAMMEELGTIQDLLMAHDFYIIDSKVEEIGRAFGLDEIGLDKDVDELSGGQRTKVLLGKLLLEKPDILLLDEPTNYLDVQHIEWLKRYLQDYENAFILISHDIPFLNSVVNLIYHMENQKLDRYVGDYDRFMEVYEMKKSQLEAAYNRQQAEIAKLQDFVARNKARVATRNMAMSRQKKLDKMEVIELAKEKPKPEFHFLNARATGKLIFETKDLVIGYDEPLSKPLNFLMERGEKIAVIGANGIGKTTLLKCMIGLLPWREGATFLYGQDIKTLKPKELWSNVSYIPQSHGFAFSYTGLEMVMLGRCSHLGVFEQPGRREIEMAEAMMEKTGITHLAKKDCNRMSGGELQMVLIARALINEPKLIILDEPETGLDFHNQILVLNMIDRLSHEDGISAIMNTHYPTNAMSVSDEAFMMNHKGRFFYGPTREVLTEENISQSFDVRVLVSDLVDNGRHVRSIVPVALTAN